LFEIEKMFMVVVSTKLRQYVHVLKEKEGGPTLAESQHGRCSWRQWTA